MIKHLLIACAVLVPFAALVALGFSLMKDPPPIVLPAPVVRYVPPPPQPQPTLPPPPPRVVEPVRPMPPPLPLEVAVIAPLPMLEVLPPLSPEAKRLPMLASVEPMIQQCFKDVSERVREPMKVTVAFDPNASGRFENVVIKKTSWQDPNLTACIIDSFEDAHFEPTELRQRRQSYTFTFGVPDAGL